MAYILGVFFRSAFLFLILTVFLHPARAEQPPKEAFLMMFCSCGKPTFLIVATKEHIKVFGLPQEPQLIAACKSKEQYFEGAKILRSENVTMETCPISI